jgi:hypothetical protein
MDGLLEPQLLEHALHEERPHGRRVGVDLGKTRPLGGGTNLPQDTASE